MTRLPLESWSVQALEGPVYEPNTLCAYPGCVWTVLERHHVWRRSFTGGDSWWVELPDGAVIGNCVWLCAAHHRLLTEGLEAGLVYGEGELWWVDADESSFPLAWQPPFFCSREAFTDGIRDSKVQGKKEPVPDVGPDFCPTCRRRMPRRHDHAPREREAKVTRRSWGVAVPVAQQEDGAAVLDELLQASRELLFDAGLPYGEEGSARYHVLATSLALFVLHGRHYVST